MFTGLVQTTGTLREIIHASECRRLLIDARLPAHDRTPGASVAVSGVCLTVTESGDDFIAADAAFETLALTTLGALEVGARVNLEPALRVGDPLGGHLVSGHVDGIGKLRSVVARGEARECWFDVPEPLRRYIAVKGSITVDGVSLTVNAIDANGFMVGLIPHTLALTTLGSLCERGEGSVARPDGREAHDDSVGVRGASRMAPIKTNANVNLEVDMLARYVERLLHDRPTTWTFVNEGVNE